MDPLADWRPRISSTAGGIRTICLLVFYSTTLDYFLVTLMDHCPLPGQPRGPASDSTLKSLFSAQLLWPCGAVGQCLLWAGQRFGPRAWPLPCSCC